ncbi:MAG: signal recognition particle-docking protein FtsY [Candidatus Tectomicrobia bacterium]|uniref:Signal recognition particle receptor FtsY n=1 Tax=Tectimicrobiota bacterium TaxID=2528274 RepID=A0A932GMU8_UNCTE|nr:signal recognition particle-docking protein FtsY [Candidatus Tectomicrobia bacterium]
MALAFLDRWKQGLAKTRQNLQSRLDWLRGVAGRRLDQELLEELEEALILADVGPQTAGNIVARLQEKAAREGIREACDLKEILRRILVEILSQGVPAPGPCPQAPRVIMVVGVNGVGKTTTIGKLAKRWVDEGSAVLLAAGDTFRAAAIEQLEIWGERARAQVVKHQSGADPAAVIYDALQAAKARGSQVVLADTAGRLHTKMNLMEELKKIKRVMGQVVPTAPHEVLLILDATTGQNAVSQVRLFHEAIGVTGLVVTKLDGTAKGGILLRIVDEFRLPVHYVGVGESPDDLREFDPEAFADSIL